MNTIWQWLVHGEGYQILSGPVILVGLVTYYAHHRCHHCPRVGRFKVGPHHVPSCNKHRHVIDAAEAGTIGASDS